MIYLIRHGQTVLNKERVLQGRSDHPLNEVGLKEAEEAAAWFREQGIAFDAVWSSPLKRAVETARIVTGADAGLQIRLDDRLLEMDYGPYEGMSLLDPPPELITFFSDFVKNPEPEGMEPLDHVVRRLGEFLEDLKSRPAEGNILIATHAIAMKGALEYLTPDSNGVFWSTHIRNCEVYAFDLADGAYTIPEAVTASPAD